MNRLKSFPNHSRFQFTIADSRFTIHDFTIHDSRFTINYLRLMQLARVIGTVVATVKNESLEGRKLLVVQTLNKDLEPTGKPMVAVDSVGAGVGELVFWCRGKEASFPFKREDTPLTARSLLSLTRTHMSRRASYGTNPLGSRLTSQLRRKVAAGLMILARV